MLGLFKKRSMKKVALFGATGQTGRIVLEKLLHQGYHVKALVRNPQKVPITHEALEVIKGDVLDEIQVAEAISQTDLVLSLFGQVTDSPPLLQTRGTAHIIKGMKVHGVKKIISLSGGGLPFPSKDEPKVVDKLIRMLMRLAVPKLLDDAIKHHQVLEESGLDWIIVRGPRLTNEPERGRYRVGWVGVNASTKIGRADLANFILSQIDDDRFIQQMPFVSY